MLGKSFIFNGNSIPYTTTEAQAAGWLAQIFWKTVAVENSQQQRQDFHGVESNPTFARGRLITLEGDY